MPEVLIVDDQPDAREPLGKFLEKLGYVVRVAADGREALVQVTAKAPDVVLLDLLMPRMSGTEFLGVLRSYRRFQSLPVVVITAVSNISMLDRTGKLGVHSILQKSKATFEDIRLAVEHAARGGAAA
jgi:CheY-like chemotaxis protein